MKKSEEENPHELWDILKWIRVHVMKVPEGAENEKGTERL